MSSKIEARLARLVLAFLGAVILISANSWFLFENVRSTEDQQSWVDHTYKVIGELEGVVSSLSDTESRQRGYLLTKESSYLTQVDDGIRAAWDHAASFRSMTTDNPLQVADAPVLEKLIGERVKTLQSAIAESQRGLKTAKIVDDGHEAMETIRRLVRVMGERERALLSAREEESSRRSSILRLTLFTALAVNLLLAFAVFFFMRRHMIAQNLEITTKGKEGWLKSNEADASALVSGEQSISVMAREMAQFIRDRVGVPAVNIYTELDGSLYLESGDGPKDVRYRLGEGLVGRGAVGKNILTVEDVPPSYFPLQSGFGESVPRYLLFVPLRFRNEIIGVIELATFAEVTEDQMQLLGVMNAPFSAGLSSARSRQRQQELLEETQRQAEELQMQQEELRTTNEELEEQTQSLMSSQQKAQVQAEELRQVNEELEHQSKALENQQESLNVKNQALETSRRKLEEKAHELERTSTYKSEFLAKMSHELRTPLNSLMILATLLQENKQGNLNPQQVEFAKTIYDSGGDLLDLIKDILDLSKLEARKLFARPEIFSLKSFVEGVAMPFYPQAEARDLKFSVIIDPSASDKLFTDRQRLQQIIRNLLSNSFKFTEKGEVTLKIENVPDVSGAAAGSRLRFKIIDTGIGIADTKKKLIWDAFEQADGSVSRKYGGTGLGLTISRELAGLLGGQISVESEEGKGSEFTLEIPTELSEAVVEPGVPPLRESDAEIALKNPPTASVSSETASEISKVLADLPKSAKTILIVEDDENFRASVADEARLHNFTVIEANTGESALEILKHHSPQAILLDIKLPGVNGLALLDIIKKMPALRHIPIHMISGMEFQSDALRMGAVGYLDKPVTISDMRSALQRIENVIDRKVKRLLIVEDNEAQRKAIGELVQGKDIEIVAVGTGHEALEIIQKTSIDCMVLDLKLPDMSGFELLENLGRDEGRILPPVVIYTGKDLTIEEESRLRRYSDSIIIKGAKSPERLLDEVSLFLHRVESDFSSEARVALSEMRSQDRNFEGRHILIVDDDLRNLFALTSALESRGFKVTVARNGVEALERLETAADIDAILMDIMMPKMDGFEAMRRIRAGNAYKELPIIALTAKAMKGEHEKCVVAGASDYLPKPIDLSNLLSVLKIWLPSQGILK
jgi:CheY-like chemotaxis protein/CHASE3 domain sensor protein